MTDQHDSEDKLAFAPHFPRRDSRIKPAFNPKIARMSEKGQAAAHDVRGKYSQHYSHVRFCSILKMIMLDVSGASAVLITKTSTTAAMRSARHPRVASSHFLSGVSVSAHFSFVNGVSRHHTEATPPGKVHRQTRQESPPILPIAR